MREGLKQKELTEATLEIHREVEELSKDLLLDAGEALAENN